MDLSFNTVRNGIQKAITSTTNNANKAIAKHAMAISSHFEEESNVELVEGEEKPLFSFLDCNVFSICKKTLEELSNMNSIYGDIVKEILQSEYSEEKIVDAILKAKDAGATVYDFLDILVSELSINKVNDALKSSEKTEIKDSDLSNTMEYNGITNQDMLALSNVAYSDIANIQNKGKTLGEVAEELKNSIKSYDDGTFFDEEGNITAKGVEELTKRGFSTGTDDNEAFAQLLNELTSDEKLSTLTILDNADQVENYINATTYGHLDENGKLKENPTVVFMGTANATAWADNAKMLVEAETQLQKAADEYIKRQQYSLKQYAKDPTEDIPISVSGQSKGGNLAMYVTLKNDNITNCVSFDGQGFNQEFIEKYSDVIDANKDKITAINSYIDPVSALLNPIAGTTWYTGVDITKSNTDNNNNIFMQNGSELPNAIWDAHSPTTLYKDVISKDGEDIWNVCDRSKFSEIIEKFSESTENMDPDKKQYLATLLANIFILTMCDDKIRENDAVKLSEPYKIEGYDLMIVKTDRGYNLYCASSDSGNTVATLTPDGRLESGMLEPYLNGKDEEALLSAIKNHFTLTA